MEAGEAKFLSITEAAGRLGCSPQAVWDRLKRSTLPFQVVNGHKMIPENQLVQRKSLGGRPVGSKKKEPTECSP